jgi:hypothetical protein
MIFSTMPDPNVTLPTLPDIGRHREPTIGSKNQFWRFEFAMSVDVLPCQQLPWLK